MFAPSSLDHEHDVPVFSTGGVPMETTRRDRLAEFVHHLGDVPMPDARRAVHRCGASIDNDPLSVVAAALLILRRESENLLPA